MLKKITILIGTSFIISWTFATLTANNKTDLVNAIHEKAGLTKSTWTTSYWRSVYVDPSKKESLTGSNNQTGDINTKSTSTWSKDQDRYVARVLHFSINKENNHGKTLKEIKQKIKDKALQIIKEIKQIKSKINTTKSIAEKKVLLNKYHILVNKIKKLRDIYIKINNYIKNKSANNKTDLVNAIHEKAGLTKSTWTTSYWRSVYVDPSKKESLTGSNNQTGDVTTKSTWSKDQDRYVAAVLHFSINKENNHGKTLKEIKQKIKDKAFQIIKEIKQIKSKINTTKSIAEKRVLLNKYHILVNKIKKLRDIYIKINNYIKNKSANNKTDLVNAIHEKAGLTKSTWTTSYWRSVYIYPTKKESLTGSNNQTGDVTTKSTWSGSRDQDKYVADVLHFSINKENNHGKGVKLFKESKVELVNKYKTIILNKYSNKINKFSSSKLKKILKKIVVAENKISNNTKIPRIKKIKIISILDAIYQVIYNKIK